ncbi:MAG: transglutaminase domain-containing protein [Clostridiales bacterium]|nr:transglutaminase domain-containing protein [Clostridiales bacterium]
MKRMIRTTAASLALILLLGGCSKTTDINTTEATSTSVETTSTETTVETIEITTETTETEPEKSNSFKYDIYATSPMYDEVMGEDMAQAYQNMLHAIMNGETEFECADQNTYDWMTGQYAFSYCPVLYEHMIEEGYSDGVGYVSLDISYEEFYQELDEFGVLVEDVLNEVFEEDYTDFEKALALYIYFSECGNFTYDYEAANADEYLDTNSILKVLETRYGICGDFSTTYSFLLAQVGVDAGTIGGIRSSDKAPHGWSIIRLNGKCYQIDPTYALGYDGWMAYFMMDTDQRENEDGYMRDDYTYVNNYTQYGPVEYDVSEFYCEDDKYSVLWDKTVCDFDPETKTMYCTDFYCDPIEIDYSELE